MKIAEIYGKIKEKINWLSPVGYVDQELRKEIDDLETEEFSEYEKAYRRYRHTRKAEISLRILLYAGLLTSFATSIGIEQLEILQTIATYIGVTLLFVFYALTGYVNKRARENLYFRREILISNR